MNKEAQIHMTLDELEQLLNQHKDTIIRHITRNLSTYHWYNYKNEDFKLDLELGREELRREVIQAPYPPDFQVLKKYLE